MSVRRVLGAVAVTSAVLAGVVACASSGSEAGGTASARSADPVTLRITTLSDGETVFHGRRLGSYGSISMDEPSLPVAPVTRPDPVPTTTPPDFVQRGPRIEASFDWAESDMSPIENAACVTLTDGITPAQALHVLADGSAATRVGSRAEVERRIARMPSSDEHFVQEDWAGRLRGGWTLAVEDNNFQCSTPEIVRELSRGGTAVTVFNNVNGDCAFSYARDGRLLRQFDPGVYADMAGHPLPQERGIRFGDTHDLHPMAQSMLLVQRLTGVRLTLDDLTTSQNRIAVGVRF